MVERDRAKQFAPRTVDDAALSMVPALLFYVVAERQLIGGLTTGAVKG